MTLGFGAVSEFPVSSISNAVTAAVGETPIYLSTHGFTSKTDDIPANTHFLGAIKTPPSITTSIVNQGGFFSGQRIRTTGATELSNADGSLDREIARFAIDGRRVVIKAAQIGQDDNGMPVYPVYSVFDTFFEGAANKWSFGTDRIRLEVRSNDFLLKVPVQTDVYDGTGGEEGTSEIEGRVKPVVFGEVENITPVTLSYEDGGDHTYAVASHPIEAVDAVYDDGVPLTFGRNYPDFASLQGASTASGEYDTCLKTGAFKLGSPPDGAVTCDVRGYNKFGYIWSTGQIIETLVDKFAQVPRKLIDHGSFATFRAIQPATVGIYIDKEGITVAQALNDLCRGAGAWWGFGQDGRLGLGRVSDPAGRTAQTFTNTEILSIERLNLPYDRPHYQVSINFRRNWSPSLDPKPGANKKYFRAKEYRTAYATDTTIKRRNLLAKSDPPIPSLFADRADAETEAERLLALYGADRSLFKITLKAAGLTKQIGDAVRVQYPRWDLQNGKTFLIVQARKDTSRNRVELILFG